MTTDSNLPPDGDWPSDWVRAALSVCVLQSLAPGASYGYAIISDLEAHGLGTIKGGTLYPLLTRLESAGHVTVEWRPGDGGPGRKYFALTDQGRAELDRLHSAWSRFTANTNDYLGAAHPAERGHS